MIHQTFALVRVRARARVRACLCVCVKLDKLQPHAVTCPASVEHLDLPAACPDQQEVTRSRDVIQGDHVAL